MSAMLRYMLAVLLLAACAACEIKSPFGEDWAKPDVALKIQIPASATDVVKTIEPSTGMAYAVEFLMPNDQWRSYIAKYYPGQTFSRFPYTKEYFIPTPCVDAARTGVIMTEWIIEGDDIAYFHTGKTAHRFVSITPDCKPGLAYVHWLLENPKPKE